MKKTISFILASLLTLSPAYAVNAGQYCKTSDRGKIAMTTSKNSYMVQCIPSGAENRLRWVKVK